MDFKNGLIYLGKTKNHKERYIRMNSFVVSTLRALRERGDHEQYVFVNSEGNTLRQRDWFDLAVEEAKLGDYTWHCNRHTFASRLVMAGLDLRTVAHLMGHKTIQMTMRYAHLAPDHEAAAVEKLVKRPKPALVKAAGKR